MYFQWGRIGRPGILDKETYLLFGGGRKRQQQRKGNGESRRKKKTRGKGRGEKREDNCCTKHNLQGVNGPEKNETTAEENERV